MQSNVSMLCSISSLGRRTLRCFCTPSSCVSSPEAQGCTRARLNETRGRRISDELAARKGCPHKLPPEANALNSQIRRLYFFFASESNAAIILPMERPGSSVPL